MRLATEGRSVAGWVFAASTAGALLLVGCPGRKSAGDKSPEAEAPPAPTATVEVEAAAPVAASAANETDVTRYPDETPIDHALGTTHVFASSVRTQASATAGTVVDSLKAETDVDQVAERQGFVLVYFIDPKDGSRKLMGWVSKSDFTAAVVRRGPLTCAPPQIAVRHPGGDSCEQPCVRERICSPGFTCTGSGALLVDGNPGAGVRFCRAEGTAPPGAQRPLDVRQEQGRCPGGYARCGAMCRLQCGGPADCGAGGHCLGGFCLAQGSAPCAH